MKVKAMAKVTNLARMSWTVFFLMLCVGTSAAQTATSFYVDPNYVGGLRNGSSTNPWQSLSDGGASKNITTTINTALGSGPVTVYFSACNTTCTANTVATTQVNITRTDTGTNVLTLDGISQYNTNESSPSWSPNVTPAPCTGFRCAATAPFATAHKFQVGATGKGVTIPIASNATSLACIGFITVQGFDFVRGEGQIANLTYIHDLTLQYNEASAVPGGSYGPGVYVGPANNGPCHTGAAPPGGTFSGPDNVTVQYNYIHDTYEDCFYDGAMTPDPPGYPSAEYSSLNLNCTTQCSTGANHLIQYNTIESCSDAGGVENVGINIKDGHTNLSLIGNTIRPTFAGFSPNALGPGINAESGTMIAGNYIEAPATVAIAPQIGWNNSKGRSSLSITNNMVVNVNSGIGHNSGIEVFGPNSGANQLWLAVSIYNNSIFNTGITTTDSCISVDSGNQNNVATVENNIMDTCGAVGLAGGSGIIALHDYNDYFNANSCVPETHGMCVDPQFISTAPPYIDSNFRLQPGSPVGSAGTNLSTYFTTDYFNATRTTPWDMSAVVTGNTPNPPTGLTAVVN